MARKCDGMLLNFSRQKIDLLKHFGINSLSGDRRYVRVVKETDSKSLIGSIKADVDLGFVLLLCMFLQYGISGVSALEPSFHRLVFLLRLKLQDTMNRIHAWLAVAPPHQKISA
ncbi:hypothetical protein Goshw_005965, partial [Gossypium schwendimanii]|nr:hypothetical protein [Gossypium schwendimanii]